MDLLALRYFQAVARHEHVSRAAAELRVAQPSLSRTIARLEAELGVPLFDRQGRQVRLNQFGARFLQRVDRALAELDDGRSELADAAGLEHGSVRVAAETLLTLIGLVARFRDRHPAVDVRLTQASAEEMGALLRDRDVDLCVASQPVPGTELRTVELMREEVLLAVPPGHHLAGRDRVRLDELVGEPFVTTRPGHWPRALLDRLFADGPRPEIVCESDEPGTTGDLIGAGLGIGLVPAFSRRAPTRAPGAWVHLDAPGCERVLTLVWREDAYLSQAAQRFSELAVSWFRAL
jgi:DNA-binding transcriptional LysR family regulator